MQREEFSTSSNGAGAMPASFEQRQALDKLFSVTYEELRRLASSVRRGDPSATLSPTALVNEAWLKLADSAPLGSSQLHFKRIAARAMRQLLVEAARRRNAHKRGGDAALAFVTFDESVMQAAGQQDVLALDHALEALAKIHPRQAMMIETLFLEGWTSPKQRHCWTFQRRRSCETGEPQKRGWHRNSSGRADLLS
jgi:RNA polymerase sigma factor (TIGR02999 family)